MKETGTISSSTLSSEAPEGGADQAQETGGSEKTASQDTGVDDLEARMRALDGVQTVAGDDFAARMRALDGVEEAGASEGGNDPSDDWEERLKRL